MKLLLPAFFIAVFILIEWQDRRELKKEYQSKKNKSPKSPQLELFDELELLHPLTEN